MQSPQVAGGHKGTSYPISYSSTSSPSRKLTIVRISPSPDVGQQHLPSESIASTSGVNATKFHGQSMELDRKSPARMADVENPAEDEEGEGEKHSARSANSLQRRLV